MMVSPVAELEIIQPEIIYPESDGEPIADNTKQFEWITTIKGGLDALLAADPDVFVAGDLLWYPVEGDPTTRVAPDVMVAFGRPKGHRGLYQQWQEDDIAPQVVFEILSPGNTVCEMHRKRDFYERYGVEEYYLYDPDGELLAGWLRGGDELHPIVSMRGWQSPRLDITFDLEDGDLVLIRPDGRRFESYVELERAREQEHERAEQEHQARLQAETQAEQQRARAERLAARLRELGISEDEF